jgi:hypothetical protein
MMVSFATRQTSTPEGSYRKPDDAAVGEQFYIKVQALPNIPLLIYDKSRQCHFFYPSDLRGIESVAQIGWVQVLKGYIPNDWRAVDERTYRVLLNAQ